MDDIRKLDLVDIELTGGSFSRSWCCRSIGMADSEADRFGVRIFRGGEPVNLNGGSVQGFFRNSQGENIALTSHGTVTGNIAYITLPQACYNHDGKFTLAIKVIGGGVTGTMRIVDGMVDNTYTGGAVAPTETVPDYQEILAVYDQMVDALDGAVDFPAMVADDFSPLEPYKIGDVVYYDGKTYRFKSNHSAGAWNAAQVDETNSAGESARVWGTITAQLLASGTDLNDVKKAGVYRTAASGTYVNEPLTGGRRYLVNIAQNVTDTGVVCQMFFHAGKGRVFMRAYHDSAFDPWTEVSRTRNEVIGADTDLNNIRDIGVYTISPTTDVTHCPIGKGGRRILYVNANVTGVSVSQASQVVMDMANPEVWTRWYADGAWTEWARLTSLDLIMDYVAVDIKNEAVSYGAYYINASGQIASSSNWEAYLVDTGLERNFRLVTNSESSVYYAVGFYSGSVPADAQRIGGINFTSSGRNVIDFTAPTGCVCMLVTNRTATSADWGLYQIGASVDSIAKRTEALEQERAGIGYALAGRDEKPLFESHGSKYGKRAASEESSSPSTYLSDYIPVTGGATIDFVIRAESRLHPELDAGTEYRVYEYDSNKDRIYTGMFYWSNTNHHEAWLKEGTAYIRFAFARVIPPHADTLEDLVDYSLIAYQAQNHVTELVTMQKTIIGSRPWLKALDHGGFWTTEENYEDSPWSFKKAAREGIVYHNLDIVFSSDGVPIVSHDRLVTDANNVQIDLEQLTAAQIKTHSFGDARYTWTPQTLAETYAYIRQLGGTIDTVDITPASDRTKGENDAASLPAYYKKYNITPAWTNFDRVNEREAFMEAGPEYGCYLVALEDVLNSLQTALDYAEAHPNTRFCVNIARPTSYAAEIEAYVEQLHAIGVTCYCALFNITANVPGWADGLMSQTINVPYEMYRMRLEE